MKALPVVRYNQRHRHDAAFRRPRHRVGDALRSAVGAPGIDRAFRLAVVAVLGLAACTQKAPAPASYKTPGTFKGGTVFLVGVTVEKTVKA